MSSLDNRLQSLYDKYLSPHVCAKKGFHKLPKGAQLPDFRILKIVSEKESMPGFTEVEEVSFDDAQKIFALLPSKSRHFLRECGKAQKSGWYNPRIGACDPPGFKSTESRGVLVLQRYLQQAGKCQYTNVECQGPGYMVIDHVVELGTGDDSPGNWALVDAELNSWKKNKDFQGLVKSARKVVLEGEDKWQNKKSDSKGDTADKKKFKDLLKQADKDELRELWRAVTSGQHGKKHSSKFLEYIGRELGIKALGTSRKKVNGEKRTGGCERNYKAVLNSFIQEYFFGSEDMALKLYENSRAKDKEYIDGKITFPELISCHASNVERCGINIWKREGWDKQKWILSQVKRRPNG